RRAAAQFTLWSGGGARFVTTRPRGRASLCPPYETRNVSNERQEPGMALEELVVHEKKIMLQEVATQPDFVRNSIDGMLESMRKVLAPREPGTLRHGFMIGCGDSYCAALAARSYMMEVTGRFVEAVEALEFSRYLVSYIPEGSFVFGISNSGTVSRTI